jgi:magnesium-transporting ATPase (P-type)
MGEHKNFDFSQLSAAEALSAVGSSTRGLSAKEARERLELHGPNTTGLPERDTRVTRGRRELTVPSTELVVGDILHLHAGMPLPADVRLLSTEHLHINRSGPDNVASTGSHVTAGSGLAVIIATGKATTHSQQRKHSRGATHSARTALQPMIRRAFYVTASLAVITMAYPALVSRMPADYILACGGIVLLAGSPWLLPLITRLLTLQRRPIVASEPRLTPRAWFAPDGSSDASPIAQAAAASVHHADSRAAMLATWHQERGHDALFGTSQPELSHLPYSSDRELASSVRAYGNSSKPTLFASGEPSPLLARCSHILIGDHRRPLSTRDREKLAQEQGNDLATGFAYRTLAQRETSQDIEDLEQGLTWIGLLTYHAETPAQEKQRRRDAAQRALGVTFSHHLALVAVVITGLALVAHFNGLALINWQQLVMLALLPLALLALPGDPHESRPLHAAPYAQLANILWSGLLAAGFVGLNFWLFLGRHHMDASLIPSNTPIHQVAMTSSLTLLAFIFVVQLLVSRSDHGLASRIQRTNRPLWLGVTTILLLTLILPHAEVSGLQSLGATDVFIALLLAVSYGAIQQFRIYDRRNHPSHVHQLHHATPKQK